MSTYAYGATAFASLLTYLKARVLTALTLPPANEGEDPIPVDRTYVRVLLSPSKTPSGSEWRAEQGVTIRVGPIVPDENCGAGRSGWKCHRDLEVFVVTESLLDEAGDDLLALTAHTEVEEQVVGAFTDTPPRDRDPRSVIGVRVTWVPGGVPPRRRADADQGIVESSVTFRCEYVANLKVDRT